MPPSASSSSPLTRTVTFGAQATPSHSGREEGDSFVRTLQGAHAERQLEILSRRRDSALDLATARRNRLLGVLLIIASCLTFAFVRAAQRIAAEVEEDRRLLAGQRSRPRDARHPS